MVRAFISMSNRNSETEHISLISDFNKNASTFLYMMFALLLMTVFYQIKRYLFYY